MKSIHWIIYFLLFFCFAISGCHSGKKASRQHHETIQTASSIFLYRSPCYGICPVYSVEIFDDGRVVYTGKKYTTTEGERTFMLSDKEINTLFHHFKTIDWSAYQDEYPNPAADLPVFQLIYSGQDIHKEIRGSSEAPKSLHELAFMIDDILKEYDILD